MNLIDAIRSGKPFRRPHWVESADEIQWCILGDDDCLILWEEGSTFGDVTKAMLLADDYEVKDGT